MRAVVTFLTVGLAALVSPSTAQSTTLGVDGTRLTVDGRATFLLGFSYYGALGASQDSVRQDLDDAQRDGFNWLRVWATWDSFDRDVSAFDAAGAPRQPFMDRLKWLVAECDRRGMIVDVTLARGNVQGRSAIGGGLPDFDAHRQAVRSLVSELRPWRNWFIDLANEHDIRDFRYVSAEEIRQLRACVQEIDRDRLVTASCGGHDLDEPSLRRALLAEALDFITPHRPRHAASPGETEAATRTLLETMQRIGRVVPVLHQEPFRRGFGAWEPSARDFLTDLRGAVAGGAAGWCFHNGSERDVPDGQPRRSFDLSNRRLYDQLDPEERQMLQQLREDRFWQHRPADPPGPADQPASGGTSAGDRVSVLQTGPQAGHYLQWRGRPLMLIGDSVTQGWMECGPHFDQDGYIDALADRGIPLVMLWAFKGTSAALQRADERIGYDAPELWPWQGSPDDASFDLRRLNPDYFARLRSFVTRAESKGIVVLITVHDGWTKTCFDGHPFNRRLGNGPLDNNRQYVVLADYDREMPEDFDPSWDWRQQNQYFQERLCAALIRALDSCTNVIYEMFNEGEWYDAEQRWRHERHFLAFFRARCPNLLLSNVDHMPSFPAHDEDLDVVTLHPNRWLGQAPKFLAGFQRSPPKPYLCSEPVPEFRGRPELTLETVQRSMWEIALAGAGWVNQNDLSFGWDPHAAVAQDAAARDAAYDLAGHCARFFNHSGVDFSGLAPEPELASTGHCLARPPDEYVVYARAGEEVAVDLSPAAGRSFQTRWYDPACGEFVHAAATAGGDRHARFRSPLAGDAVLHLCCSAADAMAAAPTAEAPARIWEPATRVSIHQGRWQINGRWTNPGSAAEGLLMNVRMVNAVFEDTHRPDFDAEANSDEFIAAIPDYTAHGVNAFTICLQGGLPDYEGAVNSAFDADGALRAPYLARVRRVIRACDRAGAVVILGCFYQRQDQLLKDEAAVRRGVRNVAAWIREEGFGNVVLEVANEFGHPGFDHPLLKTASGQAELMQLAKQEYPQLLVSTSSLGDARLGDEAARAADFLLIHFNTTDLADYGRRIEALKKYEKPIVCNEDEKCGSEGVQAAERCVEHGAAWGLMEFDVNQRAPFRFQGADDDPVVYAALQRLTTPLADAGYFPPPESQGGWRTLTDPNDVRRLTGMDPEKLAELREWLLRSDDRNFAAVVIRNGYVVLEVERGNSAKTDVARVASVSKAVCATVLAIASEQSQSGALPRRMTFDDLAFDFLPWAQPLSDPRKAQITVKQLLNHTSGLCPEALGAPNDGSWEYVLGLSGDPRTAQLAFDPGTGCGYSTHGPCHAALVCETVTGRPYDEFAVEALFKPIGCEHWWFQYYDGGPQIGRHPSHAIGMPARDLARIGYCLLHDGRWGDRQIVPQWFVAQTAQPTHDVETPELRWHFNPQFFSHGWELPARLTGDNTEHWSGDGIPPDARSKFGSGGQLLAFVPSLQLVIARQTGSAGGWDYVGYLRRACAAAVTQQPVGGDAAQ